nr:MAG TPA: pentapeptide repeat protein [Caudoviricetes sp.]
MERKVKGYKVFNPDWTCRGKQYSCPGNFEEDVTLSVCNSGMHFCKKASDCFNYYQFDPNNHVAEVVARGNVVEDGDKCATDKLEIIREIPWAELLEIVNTGKWCTGYGNSGYWNSGDHNSGNRNSGDYNSGDYNSGNRNSGDHNSGNRNSGDWNKTDFSNGCFNTVEPKIYLFNKPSSWTYRNWLGSEARYLMKQIQGDILEWVRLRNMTDDEKTAHPESETTGGYLKKLNNSESAAIWWRSLDQRQKNIIMSIPNFDKAIFKEITGIDVDKED